MSSPPFFSIVIPTYNRAAFLRRALLSVLRQTYGDFETIVVDDGSEDDTAEVMTHITDTRVRFLQHLHNRGVCPARNTGVDQSGGEWIVFLDSDDELRPEALNILCACIQQAPAGVDRIGGMYRWDDGSLSPDPKPSEQILDYEGYLRWSANTRRSDFHNCIRRSTFEYVRLPENRAYETIYHLDFARLFRTWFIPEVIALEHQDARNRASHLPLTQKARGLLRDAPDELWALEKLLQDHGEAIYRVMPNQWRLYQRLRILQAFMAGRRRLGLHYSMIYLRQVGLAPKVITATLLGLLSRRSLALAQALR